MTGSARVLRMVFVSHRFQRNDGQGRVNYEIVKAALDRGYSVTLLATYCAEEIAKHPNACHIAVGVPWLPTSLLRNLVFATVTARWIRKHRKDFDLIQANGFVTWEECDIVAAHFVHTAWKQSPYYPYRKCSPYSLYQRLITSLNSHWETRAFTTARHVIAVSEHLRMELQALGVKSDRITVIYNGVDISDFHPGSERREELNLPKNVPLGLFIGDIKTSRKNLETVLQALQQVTTLNVVVAGALAGSPYPALARSLGVADRVIFVGKVAHIARLMRSADLFIFPSRYEAHPLVVVEAMASGLPLIVSGVFGAEHFIGSSGLILGNPNDVPGLVRMITMLLDDAALRARMGEEGRLLALEMRWSIMAAKYLTVYEGLSVKRSSPSGDDAITGA